MEAAEGPGGGGGLCAAGGWGGVCDGGEGVRPGGGWEKEKEGGFARGVAKFLAVLGLGVGEKRVGLEVFFSW